jgi:hypothetical protein
LPDSALLKKLQLKPGLSGAVINAPDGYLERIGPLANKLRPNLDFVQLFVRDKAQLERLAPAAVESVKPDGLLWIAYLKGGKKAGTDLNRDLLWAAMSPLGVAGVTLIAVDDAWSAMRFRPANKPLT